MVEIHPFGSFVPKNSKYLLLGSFPGTSGVENPEYWFYGTRTTQFWNILEEVYKLKLSNRKSKQDLLTKLHMAISDVIYSCERKKGNSDDLNLINITYNNKIVENIFSNNKIQRIYFTSRFAEKIFKTKFKEIILKYPKTEFFTLPSPSPRFAKMSKEQKIKKYKELLPVLP